MTGLFIASGLFYVMSRARGSSDSWALQVSGFRDLAGAEEMARELNASQRGGLAEFKGAELGDTESVRADERAKVAAFCLDLASQEGQREKQAKKKGHVDKAVIARCKADAFRQLARDLAPPKPKKARRLTK